MVLPRLLSRCCSFSSGEAWPLSRWSAPWLFCLSVYGSLNIALIICTIEKRPLCWWLYLNMDGCWCDCSLLMRASSLSSPLCLARCSRELSRHLWIYITTTSMAVLFFCCEDTIFQRLQHLQLLCFRGLSVLNGMGYLHLAPHCLLTYI